MNRRLLPLLAVAAFGAVGLAGCAAPDEPDASASASAQPTPTAAPPAEPTTTPSVDPANVTCESLLPAETLTVFADLGWDVEIEEFRVGSLALDDGLWCKWGDFSAAAGAPVQIYGWSPIEAAEASTAQQELQQQGWVREDAPEGIYITENPDTVVSTDEAGYGMTYLFADGVVTVSDTKEGLLVIEVP